MAMTYKYRYTFTGYNHQRRHVESNSLKEAMEVCGITALDDWTYIEEPVSNDIARPIRIEM